MNPELDPKFYLKFRKTAVWLCRFVIVTGFVVFLGWMLDIDALRRPVPKIVAMNPLTGLCFMACGLSLIAMIPLTPGRRKAVIGYSLAAIPFIASLLRLCNVHFPGLSYPADSLLFHNTIIAEAKGGGLNRMGANTAFNFLLTSLALAGLHGHRRVKQYVVPAIAHIICLGALLAILGTAYQVPAYYGKPAIFPMAIHAASCFLFIGLSLLFARPGQGFLRQIISIFSSGQSARILICAAMLGPILLGLLALAGYWAGYYGTEVAIALMVFTRIVAAYLVLWRNTRERNRRDSEQAAINRSLEQANHRLQIMNEELEQFAYVSSHDLQEPLRKIRMFSDIIVNNADKPGFNLPEYAVKINESAERMSGLIHDLMYFAKLRKTEDAFLLTDLNAILASVLKDFELAIEEKQAVIEAEPLPDLRAIPMQIRQLFTNLIGNALKFSANAPVIRIDATIASPEELALMPTLDCSYQYTLLTISDNGIGFDQAYAEKVFIVFQRLNNRDEYSGSGIGLAICKKVAENHSGDIRVVSTPNEGSTFYIYLRC